MPDDPAIRFKPIAHLNQIVVARRGHPLAKARAAAALASDEWLTSLRHDVAAEALRAIGVPEPRQIIECESFSAMLTLLAESDMLALVPHPFLDTPQVGEAIQQIPIAERLPGLTVGPAHARRCTVDAARCRAGEAAVGHWAQAAAAGLMDRRGVPLHRPIVQVAGTASGAHPAET